MSDGLIARVLALVDEVLVAVGHHLRAIDAAAERA